MKVVIKLLMLFMISSHVLADKVYPVITYTCDVAADVIKIKNEVKWNEEGEAVKYFEEENNAVFNPWNWVTTETTVTKKMTRATGMAEKNCQLSSGIYKIILQPHIFNPNTDGKCGDQISILVTVLRGGTELLSKQEFQDFCHGNSPVIRGIKVQGDTGDVKIFKVARHKFY